MSFSVEITPAAERQIKKLSQEFQEAVFSKLLALQEDPRPLGVRKIKDPGKKFKTMGGLYRIKVDDYRVFYTIDERAKTVFVTKVRPRAKAYR